MHTREQKIKFLKDLQVGKATINDLKPESIVVIKNGPTYEESENDIYHITGTSYFLNKEEYETYLKNMKTAVLLPDNGRSNISWPELKGL